MKVLFQGLEISRGGAENDNLFKQHENFRIPPFPVNGFSSSAYFAPLREPFLLSMTKFASMTNRKLSQRRVSRVENRFIVWRVHLPHHTLLSGVFQVE